MKTDNKGRAFCKVEDQDSGMFVELNPEVYDILFLALEQRITGTIELNFIDGNVGQTHVRITGRKWAKNVPRGIGALIPGNGKRDCLEAG
jgi:hypothetical protein